MRIPQFRSVLLVFSLPVVLLGAVGALAQNPGHPPERGRELIGADGRTLTDKENKFSIRLPAASWKVYRDVDPGPEPFLNIANPDWQLRVEVRVKTMPLPLESLKTVMESETKKKGGTLQRSVLSKQNGAKCWDLESEEKVSSGGSLHALGRICDVDQIHKITALVQLPPAQWAAEEKALRETIESLRINP
jgi:hypothetical protein